MVSAGQLEIVERLVNDAVEKGAKALVGGHRVLSEVGNYYAPTVLVDVPENAAILHEETFGPVMVILRAKDDDEAIRIANSTEFGLSSTVMTKSQARARRYAEELVAGGTCPQRLRVHVHEHGPAVRRACAPPGSVGSTAARGCARAATPRRC
jgi:acyl-CoA reductase-like NAD-dependent aldehyde dehydrogenase